MDQWSSLFGEVESRQQIAVIGVPKWKDAMILQALSDWPHVRRAKCGENASEPYWQQDVDGMDASNGNHIVVCAQDVNV